MKFRRKPIVVEAMQNRVDDFNLIRLWMGNDTLINHLGDGKLGINTLEGVMTANVGDWIVRGIKGEFHPVKNEIFAATYEPA